MQRVFRDIENLFFLLAAAALAAAWAAASLFGSHVHSSKLRVQYGIEHLPTALSAMLVFVILVGVLRFVLAHGEAWKQRPAWWFVAGIALAFAAIWLPVMVECGLVRDDWTLLAAAAVRRILFVHPTYLWHTLDSIDGNFRPLGTSVYLGVLEKIFGVRVAGYYAGGFLINLAGSLTAFLLVRELGYTKIAGAAAAIVYMTRDMAYTQYIWISAVSDALAILFCGLCALALLKAMKRTGAGAAVWHGTAWLCFVAAALSKQTAFAMPAIGALIFLIRPGEDGTRPLRGRVTSALAVLAVYGATAAAIFAHAHALLGHKNPYPMSLSVDGLLGAFSYVTWFFGPIDFPGKRALELVAPLVGVAIVAAAWMLRRRMPRVPGERPKDMAFLLLAGLMALALLVPLGSRVTAYYGVMFAFWMSLAVGIALTRLGESGGRGRMAGALFCLLILSGYVSIQLKQTALAPPGGYIWGTSGMDWQRAQYDEITALLAASPEADTVVFVDPPPYPSAYASMAILDDPAVRRIVMYQSDSKRFTANAHQGAVAADTFAALNDPEAWNWELPMSEADAVKALRGGRTLWIGFSGNGAVGPFTPVLQ